MLHRLPGSGLVEVIAVHKALQQRRADKVLQGTQVRLLDAQPGKLKPVLTGGSYLALTPQLPDISTLKQVHYETPLQVLTRDGKSYPLDLDALNRKGAVAPDLFLKPGDHLYMPYNDRKEAYVLGEVLRPQPDHQPPEPGR